MTKIAMHPLEYIVPGRVRVLQKLFYGTRAEKSERERLCRECPAVKWVWG